MPRVLANGLQLEVESMGRDSDPAVLLVMGLGMQLTAWPQPFCSALVDAGFRVIRFDNRDIGLSDKLDSAGNVNLPLAMVRHFMHLQVPAPYRLEAMAADALGVLDALGIEQAHLVGASLGGMIAQGVAAAAPGRCLSLTSIMSSTGSRRLPAADLKVMRVLLARADARSGFDVLLAHHVRVFQTIGSPGFPTPPAQLRDMLATSLRRSYHPAGVARQMLAIIASGDRSAQLRTITAPTLVLHGSSDPLLPVRHGIDTARKVAGASLRVVPGMGHDLAPGLLPILLDSLLPHLHAADGRSRSAG